MARRVYDLYPQVYAFDKLVWVEKTAARGKRGRPQTSKARLMWFYYIARTDLRPATGV
jgi:hypothetical protein